MGQSEYGYWFWFIYTNGTQKRERHDQLLDTVDFYDTIQISSSLSPLLVKTTSLFGYLGSIPTERLRRRKQLGSVSFYVTIHI